MKRLVALGCWLALAGCGGDASVDAGFLDTSVELDDAAIELDDAATADAAELRDAVVLRDASTEVDGGLDDGGPLDAGTIDDAATAITDAGPMAFGSLMGMCGTVLDELDDTSPSYHTLHFDLMDDPFDDPADRPRLTMGAQEILADGTAGGSSSISEALAFEFLARCEAAAFVKSETEVVYDPPSSDKTDILIAIGGMRVGVSVTRAVAYPPGSAYSVTTATTLIRRKLESILESSANVVESDAWVKQILFVMAYDDAHAASVRTAWDGFDAATRADTIMYVVVTDGMDSVIYFE